MDHCHSHFQDGLSRPVEPIANGIDPRPEVESPALGIAIDVASRSLTDLVSSPEPRVRTTRLLPPLVQVRPWRGFGSAVRVQGWRFPPPLPGESERPPNRRNPSAQIEQRKAAKKKTRLRPPRDAVTLDERLLYLLQPPIEDWFTGRDIELPGQPYPYQREGIAFLMPRWSALLADEMGLGKTMQAIVALRLLLHAGLISRVLIVCPKPLVANWARELKAWAPEIPVQVIGGSSRVRDAALRIANCPVKLVNYELLARDAHYFSGESPLYFDLVIVDEAQRIKNRDSKTARVVRSVPRQRSWALTGTPVENRGDDLASLFAFLQPGQTATDLSYDQLRDVAADMILRRTKEDVLPDLPPRIVRDAYVELTAAQRAAYDLAENEGVIRLNALGDTITVQHVFELILRLKQICNFDPATGESAKLEQLAADVSELALSGRKAIIFSQWVEPLQWLAERLGQFGTLQYHGRIPQSQRKAVLHRFEHDPTCHVLLMSYGTGSVGLNLQFAQYVFLFDRWWNPAVEDQAINRVHRIGQTEPVFVTRFITPNTVEGRIAEILERKRELFNDLIGNAPAPSGLGLSEEEIFGLFDIRVRPRRTAANEPSPSLADRDQIPATNRPGLKS